MGSAFPPWIQPGVRIRIRPERPWDPGMHKPYEGHSGVVVSARPGGDPLINVTVRMDRQVTLSGPTLTVGHADLVPEEGWYLPLLLEVRGL